MKTIETKMPFCKSVSRWATWWVLAFGILLGAASPSIGQTDSVVYFSSERFAAFENSGSATVIVTRFGGTNAFSVDYTTSDGTATAGLDYTAQTGTLSFGEGETERQFTVPLLDDKLTEGAESVKVTLRNPKGQVTLGQLSEAIVWIVDDEPGATLLDPTFAPRLTRISTYDGKEYAASVSAIALQPGGKVIIGGEFDKVNGVNRGHIARLNADGSLDASFNSGSGPTNTSECQYEFVSALAATDGAIFVGGRFTSFSGVSRMGIAKLNTVGALDESFKPTLLGNPNNCEGAVHISSIVMQTDGKILIGGALASVDGIRCPGIARVNSDGTVDTTFNSPLQLSGSEVTTLALQKDGKVLVGGYIYLNEYRVLLRLTANGSLDRSFNPIFAGDAVGVNSIVAQEDGKVIVGGYFGSVNGISRSGIVRLNTDGSVDTIFDPGTGATDEIGLRRLVRSVAVQPDDKILLNGHFEFVNGLRRGGLARLHSDGSVDTSFRLDASAEFSLDFNFGGGPIVLESDGRVLIQGHGIQSSSVVRLNSGLTIRSLEFTSVTLIASESGGSAIATVERIGATNGTITVDYFTSPGTAKPGVNYVEQSGTLSFAPGEAAKVITISILDDAMAEDDKTVILNLKNPAPSAILIPQAIAVLKIIDDDKPGTVDSHFDPPPGTTLGGEEIAYPDWFLPLVVQPDSKIWISGSYHKGGPFGGRLNQDGSLSPAFPFSADPDLNQGHKFQRAIGVQSDGSAIVWGSWPDWDIARALYKVNQDGSIDRTFHIFSPGTNPFNSLIGAVQPDDKILLIFPDVANRSSVIRLTAFGKVDDTFKGPQIDDGIRAISFQADGKILLGGSWTHPEFVRLFPNGELDMGFAPPIKSNDGIASFLPGCWPCGISSGVQSILVQPDGKMLVAGQFSIENDPSRNNLARLNPDGSLDSSFARTSIPTNEVQTLAALDENGKVIIASVVWLPDRGAASTLTRLNPDGSWDRSFEIGTANGAVQQMALQPDGKLLVAGFFTEINGVQRRNIARLNGQPPFKFAPLTLPSNGELNLSFTAEPGKNYVLQATTNLLDWVSLSTNTAAGFLLRFDERGPAQFPFRFYRAVRNP